MKKILCVVLALLTLVIGSIPAAADEVGFSDPWIDILQFGGIVGQDSLKFPCNKGVHALAEVQNDGISVGYIELVFSAPNGISGLVVTDRNFPSLDQWWDVKSLTSDIYVATCEYSARSPETFKFDFYYTGGAAYTFITLLSVRALSPYFSSGKLSGQISLAVPGSDIKYGSFTNGGTSTFLSSTSSSSTNGTFNVYFTYEQWHGWDYLDIAVHVSNFNAITSVNAFCKDVVIPVYYNTVTETYASTWTSRFHLDIRNLPPSGTVMLQVGFRTTGSEFSFYTYSAIGTVDVETVPLLSRWFKKLKVWFDKLGNSITDGFDRVVNAISPTSSSDPLPDSEQQKNELKENQDIINSVTQPSFNDSSFDISGLTGSDTSIGVILATPLTDSSYIFNVFLMIFTLALGSYILFGKR